MSKELEAFEKIIEICNYYHNKFIKDTEIQTIFSYPIDNIKKDLEISEVLKPYIRIHKDILPNGITYYFLNGLETDKETYERVKEYLEK